MANEWQHGICGCFDNCGVCIITFLVPCYTAGKVAEKVGDSCILCGLLMIVPIANLVSRIIIRGKVREQKGIEGGIVGDILYSWCCGFCGLVQEAQEVHAIGGDMARE